MASILEYQVTYKYNTGDPQAVEKFYTLAGARSFMATVELWGGVAVMVEELINENDLNGLEEKHNGKN